MDQKTIYTLTGQIAKQLHEKKKPALAQIRRLIELCGLEFAEDILKQTLEIEANGGMLTLNQSRRRTPGGVFLYLARQQVSPEIREAIFSRRMKKKWRQAAAPHAVKQPPKQTQKPPAPDKPPSLPPEIAHKVQQLQLAADTLRQRVADLQQKPENQRQSLPMVERSLAKTEAQIQILLQQVAET